MARIKKKLEVQQFEGTQQLGKVKMDGHEHEASLTTAQSQTHLEADQGTGNALIMRRFQFKANPEAFKDHVPTKQELFNAHIRGIEISLWRDGLIVHPNVEPRLRISKDKTHYQIFVAASPSSRDVLLETPQTLSQITHG